MDHTIFGINRQVINPINGMDIIFCHLRKRKRAFAHALRLKGNTTYSFTHGHKTSCLWMKQKQSAPFSQKLCPHQPYFSSIAKSHFLTTSLKLSLLSKPHPSSCAFTILLVLLLTFLLQSTLSPITILTNPSRTTFFGLWRSKKPTHQPHLPSSQGGGPLQPFNSSNSSRSL